MPSNDGQQIYQNHRKELKAMLDQFVKFVEPFHFQPGVKIQKFQQIEQLQQNPKRIHTERLIESSTKTTKKKYSQEKWQGE